MPVPIPAGPSCTFCKSCSNRVPSAQALVELLKGGYSLGQVGQRPFDMGYKAIYFLKDIKDGKKPPADPTYTGLDVCTPKNADTCVGGGS